MWDHPRLRGDHDPRKTVMDSNKGSPPLARGPLSQPYKFAWLPGITPACAGTTLQAPLLFFIFRDHPRLRGDHIGGLVFISRHVGSPPLARGPHEKRARLSYDARITPACAGTTGNASSRKIVLKDHPRLRGDHKASTFA